MNYLFLLLMVFTVSDIYSMQLDARPLDSRMMSGSSFSIPESPCLHKQDIVVLSEKDTIRGFLGIGFLNSKGEVSVDLPLDILIPLGAIRNLVEMFRRIGKNFVVDILLADKNAILQVSEEEKSEFERKCEEIYKTTVLFRQKLSDILGKLGLIANTKVILGSDLYANPEYRSFSKKIEESCIALQSTDSYEREQLLTMGWYKYKECDFRLSWAVCGKKPTRRDEADFDKHYCECFSDSPIKSIYIKSGKKTLPHGLGTAVPYSFYPSENESRLSFSSCVSADFISKNGRLIRDHIIPLINVFRKDWSFLPKEITELAQNPL